MHARCRPDVLHAAPRRDNGMARPVHGTVATMRSLSCSVFLLLLSCATTSPTTRHATEYPGRCVLIGLEQRELPSEQASDHVALVATYRFGTSSERGSKPVVFAFQVTRLRAEELRSHLVAHTSVLCRPDEDTDALALPPFTRTTTGKSSQVPAFCAKYF